MSTVLHKIRKRAASEDGFTLIELLVVILIIGILAAIALPSFLNQREKGLDAEAKVTAKNAVTALETAYTDTNEYTDDPAELVALEPTLNEPIDAGRFSVEVTGDGFEVVVTSKAGGRTFGVRRADGDFERFCAPEGTGGCGAQGSW